MQQLRTAGFSDHGLKQLRYMRPHRIVEDAIDFFC